MADADMAGVGWYASAQTSTMTSVTMTERIEEREKCVNAGRSEPQLQRLSSPTPPSLNSESRVCEQATTAGWD